MHQTLRASRDPLKGLAILWIVFFHARLNLTGCLSTFQQLGYAGVDIFFFLSGFGLYHSLSKSTDIKSYIFRRAWRILPAYLPLCLLWLILTLPRLGLSTVPTIQTILGNLLMVGYWGNTPQMLNWYMSALIATLILAPFLYACIANGKALATLAFSCLIGVCFLFDERLIMVSRLPVFVLGMCIAMPREKKTDPRINAAVYSVSFIAGAGLLALCMTRYPQALLDYGMYWYPFALMTPPICAGLGWLFHRFSKVFAPLGFIGRASFEIFLFNCGAEVYLKKAVHIDTPTVWLWVSLGSIVLGCVYHYAINRAATAMRKGCKQPS